MRVVGSVRPSDRASLARPAEAASDAAPTGEHAQSGRALVVMEDRSAGRSGPARPSAPFLAQLIATAQQAPQTRQRRRAEPDEASASYARTSAPSSRNGDAFSRRA